MPDMRCAMAVLPRQEGDTTPLMHSIERAKASGLGDFAQVELLDVLRRGPIPAVIADAADKAAANNADWLLIVGDGETLAPDVFVKTAPALRVHDAVWGAAALAPHTTTLKVERMTRLAAQDLPTFFHAALRWWIGPTHFVRPAHAAEAADATRTGTYADYLYALWARRRCYKTAQALTLFEDHVPPVAEADRSRLIDILEREPAFMPIRFGERTYFLPYTGLNPVIEREQKRGLFFEQEELDFLADRLPRGLRILDVGANTGNHTIFFAGAMQAAEVIPIEPLPRAAQAIRAAVKENNLTNVDISCLGKAVGAGAGRVRAVPSTTAGLGATHFVADPNGDVPVVTLDAIVNGRVDLLKLDVEGMEMDVLSGASRLIDAHRPALYVEVVDTAIARFMAWVDGSSYRIEKLFPDKTHCNYLLTPAD